ncbi:MAG TPA: hypothetical protein VF860_05875 [Candidatus Acidoferrales bacterium]
MKPMASGKRNSRSNGSWSGKRIRRAKNPRFVVCIRNKEYEASLQLRRIYRTVPDERAASRRFLRIIDESGEDYLYPEDYFFPISLPKEVEKAF